MAKYAKTLSEHLSNTLAPTIPWYFRFMLALLSVLRNGTMVIVDESTLERI